jgi:conjugation system TraG family ATPase
MKKQSFQLPFVGIDDSKEYAILYTDSGDGSIVIGLENPVVQYSADQDAYYDFHGIMTNIIKLLGAGYTIQKQDIFSKKTYSKPVCPSMDYLESRYHQNFEGRIFKHITTYLVITQTAGKKGFFTYDAKRFDIFLKNVTKILEILKQKDLHPTPLSKPELEVHIKRYMAFDFSKEQFSFENMRAGDDFLEIGDLWVKNISLIDIDEVNIGGQIKPYRDVNLGFLFPVDFMQCIHNVPCETLVFNQIISIPDQRSEYNKLEQKKKRHSSMPDPANQTAVADIEAVFESIAKDNQLLVYGHYNLIISAKDNSELQKAANYIESALFEIGIFISKNAYNQLELFRTGLIGNAGELKDYDKFLTTSDAAICLLFKERLPTDEISNFQVRFCDRQGVPIAIDTSDLPMETNRINNRNKFVLGPSGSGKSFFMNHLVRQYFLHDTDIVLVDTGHSYSGLCSYYKGKYITYTETKPITMNPFRINEAEYNEEKREFLKSLIGLLWKGADGHLNQVEDSVLMSTIPAYYKQFLFNDNKLKVENGENTVTPERDEAESIKGGKSDKKLLSFNSFYEFSIEFISDLQSKERINFDLNEYQFILKKFYKGGEYETILNDDIDQSLFDESFIVFEIDAIKEHKILFPITTIIIMDVFLQKMRHKKNRKALIIEEAWKAIASPMMAGYILYLYKTVRKFWGEAVVVTQELDDIIGNEIVKNSIVNNSDTICLLDQTKFKDNYKEIAALLSLNDIEQKKIFTINNLPNKEGRGRFKEVYIKRGSTGEVYGVEVSLHEYLTFTTERKEKEAIQFYIEQHGGDYRIGLDNFVTDFHKSGKKLSEFVHSVSQKAVYA